MSAGGIDDAARDNGTDERGGGAEEVEKREEEEFFAARRHLGDLCSITGVRQPRLENETLWEDIIRGSQKETAYHDLRITVVRRNETPPALKHPEFPRVMEPDLLRPDTYQTPHVEENDTESNPAVHSFVSELILLLNSPIAIDSNELSRPPNHAQVVQLDEIVLNDCVLKSCDHCKGGEEWICQQKVAWRKSQ